LEFRALSGLLIAIIYVRSEIRKEKTNGSPLEFAYQFATSRADDDTRHECE
jgi:hypothetical protein